MGEKKPGLFEQGNSTVKELISTLVVPDLVIMSRTIFIKLINVYLDSTMVRIWEKEDFSLKEAPYRQPVDIRGFPGSGC